MTFYLPFVPIFSNGMEVDGLHIRVDLTGQNNKVINIIRNISPFSLVFHLSVIKKIDNSQTCTFSESKILFNKI